MHTWQSSPDARADTAHHRATVPAMSPLPEQQALELVAAVEECKTSNGSRSLHGFEISFTPRPKDPSRTDMLVVAPGGQKLFSIVALKRLVGLAPPPELAPESALADREKDGAPQREAREKKAPKVERSTSRVVAVGQRVSIRWVGDDGKPWYQGVVVDINTVNMHALVKYDDGDSKWHDLAEEEGNKLLRWIGEPPGAEKKAAKAKLQQSAAGGGQSSPTKKEKAPPPGPPPPHNFRPPLPPAKKRIKIRHDSPQDPP